MKTKWKTFLKYNGIFFAEFLYFCFLFYTVPPINDRWMEGIGLDKLESLWRGIVTMLEWCTQANARFFSNIFSLIIDYNILVRSIVNAGMLTACSIIFSRLAGKDKRIFSVNFFSVIIFFLTSLQIKTEVYYYATTLYISGMFLALLILYLIKDIEKFSNDRKRLLGIYGLIFIGSMWIENISLGILAICFGMFMLMLLYNKVFNKYLLAATCVSFTGFILMFLSARLATNGRLDNGITGISIDIYYKISYVCSILYSNAWSLLWICIVCFGVAKRVKFKHRISMLATRTYWMAGIIMSAFMVFKLIYNIISSDPQDGSYVNLIYAWKKVDLSWINTLFDFYGRVWLRIYPLFLIIGVGYLIYFAVKLKIEIILVMLLGAVAISSVCLLYEGERIVASAVWLMDGIGLILWGAIASNIRFCVKKVAVYLGCFFTFMECGDEMLFLKQQVEVAKMREEIASEVKIWQNMGKWDENTIVHMPAFTEGTRALLGENRKNPDENDIYYGLLLSYYGLDQNTKVVFK